MTLQNAPSSPSVHIYVCHHRSGSMFSDGVFRPIHVGRALADRPLDITGDDTGENISSLNPSFCELTAIFWAWKNDSDADWVGLMHYRRFLAFKPQGKLLSPEGQITHDTLSIETIETTGLNEVSVRSFLAQNPDVNAILPQKWSVRNVGSKSLFQQYRTAPFHFERDLLEARTVLAELYPGQERIFDQVLNNHEGYFTNIFVLKRDLFERYCTWLFSILFELKERLDISDYSVQAGRVFGYIAERLFTVFLATLRPGELRAVELERIFIARPDLVQQTLKVPPAPPVDAFSVVIAAEDGFAPHLGALIVSLRKNVRNCDYLDLIIFDGGISADNRRKLEAVFGSSGSGPGSLYFLDCSHLFLDIKMHAHFSKETLYRLKMGELLPNHDRVLYLDCDTIVLKNIAPLWNTHLDGKIIAAVPDIIMKSFVNTRVLSLKECGSLVAEEYLRDYLGMGDRYNEYFQAGVILFDLDAFRKLNISDTMEKDVTARRYWFLDQDVLNRHFLGKICFIEGRWNFVNMASITQQYLNAEWSKETERQKRDPAIIHYAGYEAKPWNNLAAPLAEYYWENLRSTPWYEEVLHGAILARPAQKAPRTNYVFFVLRSIWRRLPQSMRWRLRDSATRIAGLFAK
jgi:lipopolysaccharide biosynthesis glycosyltransferase